MSYWAKFQTAINNPKSALRYLLHGSNFKFNKKYLIIYNAQIKYNQKNSKYPFYFDFCKRIHTDSVSKHVRKKLLIDLKSISDEEIENEIQKDVSIDILAGLGWPQKAITMIGLMRLENLQFCIEDILENNVKGDLIECGVWRGGATIFMQLILKKYEIRDRTVFVADSFEGLPAPNSKEFPADEGSTFHKMPVTNVTLDEVKHNFKLYDVLDDNVKFLKGWFKDTLPNTSIENLAILRLDGDMYESTWQILENLYRKVSVGGFVIVDDFNLPQCVKAVNDFRKQNNITEKIEPIDGLGVFWKKLK